MNKFFIKKEVIEKEKEIIISGLPFNDDKKDYFRKNVDSNDIFLFFLNVKRPDQLKGLNLKDASSEFMHEYIPFVINLIKVKILTALLNSAIQLHLISENMTFDEKINILIDLKNIEDITLLQSMIADTLENEMNNNL